MKKYASVFCAFIAPVLIWTFPVFFLYTNNVKEMQFWEIIKPGSIFVLCSIVLLLIGKIIFKTWETAGFFSLLNGIVLGNFMPLLRMTQKVFPVVRYWHLLSFVLLVNVFIGKSILHKKDLVKNFLFAAIVAVGGLIIFNSAIAIPTIISKMSLVFASENKEISSIQKEEGKANIYYLLCDEYASFAQLEQDFNYDNSEFKTKLQNLGFNISENSYNDSFQTVVVMANIMQLNYVATDDTTSVELEQLTQNGLTQEILTENGYTLRGIGDTSWLGIDGTIENGKGSTTADGTDVTVLALDKSFLGALIKRNYSLAVSNIVNTLKQINEIEIEPNTSTFTMFYVPAPHHPYYLKSDGSVNSADKWKNDDTGKNNDAYIGELEYVNKKIFPAVERIIEKDPDSIIVLCSDHGNRFGKISPEMKTRILNAVYYKGRTFEEFKGMSGVNTLRCIFNTELGLDLPYIDLPI